MVLGHMDDMFTIKNTTYNMRDNMKLMVPNPKTVKHGELSLKYEGSRLWNMLINDTKLAVNLTFLNVLSCYVSVVADMWRMLADAGSLRALKNVQTRYPHAQCR